MPDLGYTVLIPILTVSLSLSIPIVWIITRYRRSVRELEQRHKERMAAIEKGLDLPPEPVPPPGPAPRPRYLLRGLVWLGAGLAVALALGDLIGRDTAGFGWVAVAVGAAYLIFYVIEGRHESTRHENSAASQPNAESSDREGA